MPLMLVRLFQKAEVSIQGFDLDKIWEIVA